MSRPAPKCPRCRQGELIITQWFEACNLINCQYFYKNWFSVKQDGQTFTLKPNWVYPEETEGTRLAAEVRARCNNLTREERQDLLDKGLRIIYNPKIDFIDIGLND